MEYCKLILGTVSAEDTVEIGPLALCPICCKVGVPAFLYCILLECVICVDAVPAPESIENVISNDISCVRLLTGKACVTFVNTTLPIFG